MRGPDPAAALANNDADGFFFEGLGDSVITVRAVVITTD